MLVAHSREERGKIDGVLDSLGANWRIFGQSYKIIPTETITHAPVECVMQLLPKARGRQAARMRLGVQPIVKTIADERRARFGRLMQSELEARFDTRFCTAAAWTRGKFTLEEMRERAYRDEQILMLRDAIELVPDDSFKTFEGCWLEVEFTDGTREHARIEKFLGTPGNPLPDDRLAEVFRQSAAPVIPTDQVERLLEAVWSLDQESTVGRLMGLARIP
jgi:2-methylcitrate dehydratase PrpD